MSEPSYYSKMVERNLGILGEERQEKLRNSTIPVFGVGALGSVSAEILVRSGVGGLRIVDIDHFEASNLNRQLHCYNSTLGEHKVDATKRFLLDVNPELRLDEFYVTDDDSIGQMLEGSEVVLMCIDDIIPSIHVARRCMEAGLPMIESVAMPYLNVRVFDKNSVSFETFYGFGTENMSIEELYNMSYEQKGKLVEEMIKTYAGIEGVLSFYNEGGAEKMMDGNFSTFAPMVWMQSAAIALEAVKLILDWGTISYAPDYAMYDPFTHKMVTHVGPDDRE